MSHMLQLVGSAELLDFYSDFRIRADGVDMGHPSQRPRTITIPLVRDGTQTTFDQFRSAFTKLRRLLHEARDARAAGLGRVVSLEARPSDSGVLTTYYVLGGDFPEPAAWSYRHHTQRIAEVDLALEVEPYGFGSEVTLVSGGTLRNRNALTHRFVHHTGGTVFSVNLAAQTWWSFWQTTKFSTSLGWTNPAAGDALYFGSTLGTFDRLIFGLQVAAPGAPTIGWSNWQYWNGSAWTVFNPLSNDFLGAGGNPLGLATSLGQIVFPTLAGWAATTVNGVSAYWIRLEVSTVSGSPFAPELVNGPVRTLGDIAGASAPAIDGDVPAAGLIHLKNPGATALAGARASLASGALSSIPPPFNVSLLSATAFVPTSGDNTVAVAVDTEAAVGERVTATLAPALSDGAQAFDGSTQSATVAISSGDKIDSIGSGDFLIEVGFVLDEAISAPMPLVSRWGSTNRVFWFGIDDLRLRGMVSVDGTKRRVVNGNRRLEVGKHYMGTLEFKSAERKLVLHLDSKREGPGTDVRSKTIHSGVTTALRLAQSNAFATTESRNGVDAEVRFKGAYDWAMIHADTVKDYTTEVLGDAEGNYTFPNDPATETKRADHAKTRGLWQMDDNAATTTIVDSAVLFNGAGNIRSFARTGNTNVAANRRPGVLNIGVGSFGRLLGGEFPPCLIEQFPGIYRVILMASPSTTLTALDDVAFQLQLNVGDGRLRMGPPAFFPALTAPPSSGYFPLDLGTFAIPPGGLYEGHRGSGSARNFVQWSLFVKHRFVSLSGVVHLDNFYLLPQGDWVGEYDAFDDTYEAAYAIAQNEGVAWDSRGPEPLVYQTTTTGLTVQDRNPYAVPIANAPRFRQQKPAWLIGLGFRGDAAGDYLYRVLGDTLSAEVRTVPRWRGLAGS